MLELLGVVSVVLVGLACIGLLVLLLTDRDIDESIH